MDFAVPVNGLDSADEHGRSLDAGELYRATLPLLKRGAAGGSRGPTTRPAGWCG